MAGLLDRIKFAFQVNYHSNGQWLLYAEGWQIGTPTADDPIYYALSGNLDNPAIAGLPPWPELGRPLRHQRRDDRLRTRHNRRAGLDAGARPRAATGCGFVFPDDEALVQAEFERNLPFADSRGQLRGGPRPTRSRSPRDPTKPFYLNSDDPYKTGIPGVHFTFTSTPTATRRRSRVLAKRSLGAVTLKYRINGGAVQSAATTRVERRRSTTTGRRSTTTRCVGDGHGHRSRATRSRSGSTGGGQHERLVHLRRRCPRPATACWWWRPRTTPAPRPVQASGPALPRLLHGRAGRQRHRPRTCTTSTPAGGPRPTTSACSATTTPSSGTPATTLVTRDRRAGRRATPTGWRMDEMLEVRDVHERGRPGALHRRQCRRAVHRRTSAPSSTTRQGEIACNPLPPGPTRRGAWPCVDRGDGTNDVLQYWFGGYLGVRVDGTRRRRRRLRRARARTTRSTGLTWAAQRRRQRGQPGPQRRRSSRRAASCRPTIPAVRELALGEVGPAGRAVRPAHRRPLRLLADRRRVLQAAHPRRSPCPAGGGRCRSGRRTTPRRTGTTCSSRRAPPARTTGRPCPTRTATPPGDRGELPRPAGSTLHPQLDHYQTWDGDGDLHADRHHRRVERRHRQLRRLAAVGVDLVGLRRSAGGALDRLRQRLGAPGPRRLRRRRRRCPTARAPRSRPDLDGWAITGPPAGSAPNANNFIRTDASGFPVGNAISTPHSLLLGFGLEGVSTPRNATR